MVRKQREKAQAGDPVAMYNLGQYHFHGINGLKEDRAEARRWFQLSADCGDEDGLSLLGWCYLGGWGVEKEDNGRGLAYLMEGATLGSEYGCHLVGDAFASGYWSLPVDAKQAAKWYRKMPLCKSLSASDEARRKAVAWLRENAKSDHAVYFVCDGDGSAIGPNAALKKPVAARATHAAGPVVRLPSVRSSSPGAK
jgi:TPR repeat protein